MKESMQIFDNDLREDSREWKATKACLISHLPRYRAIWLAYANREEVMEENVAYEADDEMVVCCDKQNCSCKISSFLPQELLEIKVTNQESSDALSESEWDEASQASAAAESSSSSSSEDTESSGASTCVAFDVSFLPSPTGSSPTNDNLSQSRPTKTDVLELLDSTSLSDDCSDKENAFAGNPLNLSQKPEIIVIDSDDELEPVLQPSKYVQGDNAQQGTERRAHHQQSSYDSRCSEIEYESLKKMNKKMGTQRRTRVVVESSDDDSTSSSALKHSITRKSMGKNQFIIDSDNEDEDDIRLDTEDERQANKLLGKIKALSIRKSKENDDTFRKKSLRKMKYDLVDSDDEGADSSSKTSHEETRRDTVRKATETKVRRRKDSFIVDSDEEDQSEDSDVFSYGNDKPSSFGVRHDKDRKLNNRDKMTKSTFRRTREQLAQEFFVQFDKKVFDGKLSADTKVVWSNKLRTTAGLTRLKAQRQGKEIIGRSAVVELSTKVLEDSQRLRATLMHELCHAAQWLEDGVSKPPHGEVFKKWARLATRRMPDIPVTVKHDYEISFKYTWKCVQCNGLLKRHSRSVDVQKHVCGRCRGRLVEVEADGTKKASAPARPPSAYNQFIKDNSANVRRELEKRQTEKVTQAQVLKHCARLWKEQSQS
ncbi:hypothetical protein FisN_22Lh067 [Fistulifera solaris]|uniref:SprT-like domain-containing protein n=1 Tax=Fistulifera solaris TaxID=1519565 RepID=A0A1Z5JBL1_FISSO|nr:hypothetical protein FisN_22Lh067 [Fistulifera solaris]|eukprot:GAX11393.1 hypothetical protein FisN_22Lh067 [Fistulifera solaris]